VTVTPQDKSGMNITLNGPIYMNTTQDITLLADKITANLQRRGRY
jgi:hypothetical protein